jgi:PIN domain nuclease of toxin-antitoxin system
MRLLLDTHAALWWVGEDRRLSGRAAEALARDTNEVLLSAVVIWELAIKQALGKLKTPGDLAPGLIAQGAIPLPVTLEHAAAVADLSPARTDPFDRLLVAQAKLEGAVLVTADKRLAAYGVPVLW